ncbi:MAG: T9SS type A sorting domain-containing protein [Bacteroidetes bacterium]|nr:MAG: T9SS type A sorting domain-containing protein [Bacteroidota bacterium]
MAQCIDFLEVPLDHLGLAAITAAQVDDGSYDPDGDPISYQLSANAFDCSVLGDQIVTLTVTDQPYGFSDQCVVTVRVIDNLPPELIVPADAVVDCDADTFDSGMATATDNCDVDLTFEDVVLSGDCQWECTIERTWTAEDQSGNMVQKPQMITKTAINKIKAALAQDVDGDGVNDPIILGYRTHTLTIGTEAAPCIIQWMPGQGGDPWELPFGNYMVDGINCNPGPNLLDATTGKLDNAFLTEAVILAINLRLEPGLGDLMLRDCGCDIPPIILQALPPKATVRDLFRLSNFALGGVISPFFMEHTKALREVNKLYDMCAPDIVAPIAANRADTDQPLKAGVEEQSFTFFPNPTSNSLYVNLGDFIGEKVQLTIYDRTGRTIMQRPWAEVNSPVLEINLNGTPNGMYTVELRTSEKQWIRKLIVVKN